MLYVIGMWSPLTKVSVIVTSKGGDERLPRLIEVLKRQTFRDFELVLTHNPTVSEGYNAGIRKAKGEILVFTEADCIPTDDWLQELVSEVEEGKMVAGIEVFPSALSPSNIAIRKEDLGSVRFDPRFSLANDTEFFLHLISRGIKIKRIDKAVVFHIQKRKPKRRLKLAFGIGIAWARLHHMYHPPLVTRLLTAPIFRIIEETLRFLGSVYGLIRFLPDRRRRISLPKNWFEDNEAINPRS